MVAFSKATGNQEGKSACEILLLIRVSRQRPLLAKIVLETPMAGARDEVAGLPTSDVKLLMRVRQQEGLGLRVPLITAR